MSCGVKIEARRNGDLRRTYTPSSRRFTFSGLNPMLNIRRSDVTLLSVTPSATPNGSVIEVVGDSFVATILKEDIALLDSAAPDLEPEVLFYDLIATDGTGFENWLLGGPFIVLGLNETPCETQCGDVEVSLNGQCVEISIEGGNIGAGASVSLADLNQAVASAEQSAQDAAASASTAASAGATAGASAGSESGATAGASSGAAAGEAAAEAVLSTKADINDSRIVGAAQRDAVSNEFTGDQIIRGQVSIGDEATTEETAKFYVGHISTNPSPPIGPAVAAIQCRMDFQPTGNSGANPDGVYGTLWYNSAATFDGAGAAVRANAYTIAQPGDGEVNVLNLVGLYGRARHEAKGTVTRAMSILADGGPFTKAAGAGTIESIMGMYVVASATATKNYGILFSGLPADGSIAAEANTDLSFKVSGSGSQEFVGLGRSARAVVTVMADASAQNYGQIAFGSTAGVYGTASAAASGVVVYGCSLYMNTNTGDYRRQNTILRPSGLIFNRNGDGTAEIAFATTGTQDSIIGGFTSPMAWDSAGVTTIRPPSSATPAANGDVVIQATSNTSLTFKYKGSDGVVRSGSITLS